MPVLGPWSVTLEVPSLEPGLKFYQHAGLEGSVEGNIARLRCPQQSHESIVLVGGAVTKRLHHVTLRASGLEATAARVPHHGGRVISAPEGFTQEGLWVSDPHGMRIHLIEASAAQEAAPGPAFVINTPGRMTRVRRSAMRPSRTYAKANPLRLGHVLVFTPDVSASVDFVTGALGMGLSDRAQDVIAFCCATVNSDHHVLAFAKSPGIGFHHASFEVTDPDEVGRGGSALFEQAGRGGWGFGRHTIGSNFFHYVQDPWGSWFEYFSDMDYIDDHALWTASNYDLEDSLANWAPPLPHDFVHNYELDRVTQTVKSPIDESSFCSEPQD
jgi:catechol 2,3-dioxygenase-like lactoylglutathione lyase family enzyme/predicted enzyme related to lactoylglutathione lyase